MFFGDVCFSVVDVCSSQSHNGISGNADLLLTKMFAPRRCFASEPMVLFDVGLNSAFSTAVLHLNCCAALQGKLAESH